MNLKRWVGLVVALLFLAALIGTAAAEVSGINIIGSAAVSNAPAIYLEVRALDSAGAGLRTQQQDFKFTASNGIELSTGAVVQGNRGHIIVVDTSLYYYGSQNIKIENIREIAGAYLSRLSSDERVMFVLASDNARATCTNYMSLEHAREYAQGIEFSKSKSANINSAIHEAFQYATSPAQGAPLFNSVFVIADPDLENNQDREHTLNECVQLRAASGKNFDLAVAVLRRERFLLDTDEKRRKALNEGFSRYEEFAKQCGGEYIQIAQDNSGVDTNGVYLNLSSWLYTTHDFCVDFSALSGHIPLQPQIQNVKLSIACGGAVRELDVQLDTALLPEPQNTPVATPDVPTPTPAPTPVVVVGQTDETAMQAIYALNQLNYLKKTNVREFDNECFIAYIDFCKNNGLDPRDGIYQETYDLMIHGEPIAAIVATPEPTATPLPTIPPEGYAINDQDTEHSGGYIAQIQAILKNLNCYDPGVASNVGRMDQATVDAANRYCEAYNWRNDHPNGVSKAICTEILTNGSKVKPIKEVELTLQEKAKAFLAGTTHIVQFDVPNWILVVTCFALVIAIVLIIILSRPAKKVNAEPHVEEPLKDRPQTQMAAETQKVYVKKDESVNPEGETANPYNSKTIYLDIRYAGVSRYEEYELQEDRTFTIGRQDSRGNIPDPNLILDSGDKSASRGQHAVLRYRNGQVYVSDLSKYHNTQLNGMSVFEREGRDGVRIESGDEITISNHIITIKW